MSRSPSLATTGAPTFWPTARSSSTRRVVLAEGNSGVSSTSLTVIVTVIVSSMSLLAVTVLPLASFPSLTRTTRTWEDMVAWSRAALVRSWPLLESISKTLEAVASE